MKDAPTDIHLYFGLSYANYLVLHRTLLQSMPLEWQHRFVAMLQEFDAAFEHVEKPPGYNVIPCEWREPWELDTKQLKALGWKVDRQGRYYDPEGNEVDARRDAVPVPVMDPVPHYWRGRARIEPKTD